MLFIQPRSNSNVPCASPPVLLPCQNSYVSSSNGNQYSLAMPFVDLHSQDDFASIFYTTNTTFSNVSAFDPERPTIIVLHPLFLDSTWLDNQFGDPRLSGHYNVIAFDMRTCGRSRCRSSGRHDSWVDSADLAFCCQVSLCYGSVFFSLPRSIRSSIYPLVIFWPSRVFPSIAPFDSPCCTSR